MGGNFEAVKVSKPIESYLYSLRLTTTGRAYMESACGWYVDNEYNLAINDTIYVFNFDVKQWTLRQL
jgi:hypothetical protein